MNTFTRRLLATSAAVLLVGAAATAMARGPGGCDGHTQGPRAEKMQQRMADKMAQRQAELKAALQLTPAQEPAWQAFTAATQMPPLKHAQPMRHEDMAQLTTPQRLEKMQAFQAERDAHRARRMEATRALYAVLTPEQQKVFDAQTLRKPHGERGHGMHRG